jgi:hypothetical protein
VDLLALIRLEEFLANRNAYSYPAVGLDGSIESWTQVDFLSTLRMDRHHHELLTCREDTKVVLGYFSAVFWGYFSGQDGVLRAARAHSRVRLALKVILDGRLGGVESTGRKIRAAASLLETHRCGEALSLLWELPQLGPAFASKVCAFLAPTECGVVDSIIAAKYQQFGFCTDRQGNVKKSTSNAGRYDSYCSFLRENAEKLNQAGSKLRWKDRDTTLQAWRAVDVERALY